MDSSDNSADFLDLQNVPEYLLKCFNCNHVFNEEERHPRLLSCLHCICFHCLQANSTTKGQLICGFCKEKYRLSNIRFSAFPRDNTKSGLLKLYQLKNSECTFKCQECEDELPANFFCETCSTNLCDECHKYHKRAKKSHVVYSLQELPWSIDSVKKICTRGKCEVHGHQDQSLDFYCEKCDVCVCSKCVLTVHKDTGHQIFESQNVLERKRTHLATSKSMLENKRNQIDKTIQSIEREFSEIAVKSNDVSVEISKSFENAFQILKNRRQELLNELNVLTERKTAALKSQLSHLQSQKQDIENACTFLLCSLTSVDSSAVLNIAPIISSRFTHLNAALIDTVPKEKACFKYLDTGSQKTSLLLGKLLESSVYGPKTQVTISGVVYEGKEAEISIILYDYDGNALKYDDMEVSVVISKEEGSCVDSVTPCSLRENGIYSCKFQISSQGKYQVNISVLGYRIDAEPLTVDIESAPVLASAQKPVYSSENSRYTEDLPKSKPYQVGNYFGTLEEQKRKIEVRGVHPNTTDELIQLYFENKSGGGKINQYERIDDVVYIVFKYQQELESVCSRTHIIDGAKVKVSVCKVPQPFVITGIDAEKLNYFIKHSKSIRKLFEEMLHDMYANVSWSSATRNKFSIHCTLLSDTEDYRRLDDTWSAQTKRFISEFLEAIVVQEIAIPQVLWKHVVVGLRSITIPNPDDVAVNIKSENNKILLVGYQPTVDSVCTHVKDLITKINRKAGRGRFSTDDELTVTLWHC